jgi:hypothetical protein
MGKEIKYIIFSTILFLSINNTIVEAQSVPVKLDNPFSVKYLKAHLRKSEPKLFFTPAIERNLKKQIKVDLLIKNYYQAIKLNAEEILHKPFLERKLEGKRLLSVSREMLYRMNILGMVYRIEKDPVILKRINDELIAICNFSDWHPSHPLDVAEMSLAVAIGIDWTSNALPKATIELAKNSLIEKGINASFKGKKDPYWLSWINNWNQVCTSGLIAASIVVADENPELAANTISKCLNGMPNALHEYSPDGAYPEGPVYWGYGSSFTAIASSVLESAFGKDFGIAHYPSLLKSADYRLLTIAPSGLNYDYGDCRAEIIDSIDITYLTLAWFAKETGNRLYINKQYFLKSPESMKRVPRIAAIGLIWLSEFQEKKKTELPLNWEGWGPNPIVVFRSRNEDKSHYYFAAKGGQASLSHGNMDAGSFIFELDGVRWVIDPGTQEYNNVEKTGFDLWGSCQNCQRWSLLSKSNFGHSTLTVDNARFEVGGKASIIDFKEGVNPEATFEMTPVFKGHLKSEKRKFIKDSDHSITIQDHFILDDSTKNLTWAIMTTAHVLPSKSGAVLNQDGKQLFLKVISPADVKVSIISLNPPPLEIDTKIENLKRVELRVPAYLFKKSGTIEVRLSDEND